VPEPTDWLRLTGFSFPCRIGVTDREQQAAQRLDVEIGLSLNLDGAAGGDLSASVDYGPVLEQVKFIAQQGRWKLLESLGAALAAHLLRRPAENEGRVAVATAHVRLSKPEAFPGGPVPGIDIQRSAAWLEARARSRELGGASAFVLQESRGAGAWHVDIPARAAWTPPPSMQVMIVAGALECDGRRRVAGEHPPFGSPWISQGPTGARVLAVGRPPQAA
jgi:dihydroneopterin aldolase